MKAMLLATAMIAAPIFAQSTMNTAPATDTDAPAAEQTMTDATETAPMAAQPAPTTAPATDANMTAPVQETTATAAPAGPMPRVGGTLGAGQTLDNDPPGYQPPAPPAAPPAGTPVTFQASADPATAYPPPAPQATYPICKKGQYDNCMERSTASGARHPSQPK